MFLRKRIRPAAPISLVKLWARTWSSISGVSSSTPIKDQVPELMYTQSVPWAGTAATAEAVSWLADRVDRSFLEAGGVLQVRQQAAEACAGRDDFGQDLGGHIQLLEQFERPTLLARIVKL